MARPVGADADATRKRILDTARVLFSNQGVDGTSMRQIAGGAEVSLATVHHYYGSKAELYERAVESMVAQMAVLRDELLPLVNEVSDPQQLIERVMKATYRFAVREQKAVRLLMRTVFEQGRSEESTRRSFLLPMLEQGAPAFAAMTGLSEAETRMTLLSLNHLVIRYALYDNEELVEVIKAAPDKRKFEDRLAAAHDAVEAHLVAVAKRLLPLAG